MSDSDQQWQPMADDLLGAMASLRRTTRRYARRPAELSSLTGAQLELVRLVRRRPGVSVAEAAADLSLAPNTVSTLVRQLTDLGVLLRGTAAADRRVARLDLHADIRRKVEAWRDRRTDLVASGIAQLSSAEKRCLHDALGVLDHLGELMGLDERQVSPPTPPVKETGAGRDEHRPMGTAPTRQLR